MHRIELAAEVAAPIDSVWSVFTDHLGWQRWSGLREVVLRRPGDPFPNGVGAARVMRASGVAVEEEITEFSPPCALATRLVGGLPVRDCTSRVELERAGENTRLVWSVTFRALLPLSGGLIERLLRRELQGILDRFVTFPFESVAAADGAASRDAHARG